MDTKIDNKNKKKSALKIQEEFTRINTSIDELKENIETNTDSLNDIESTLKAYRRTLTQIANVLNEQQRNAKLNKNQQTPLEDAKPNTSIKAYEKNHLSSNITFSSIAGLHEAKQAFENKIILPFKHPEIFNKYRVKKGGGILLYGLPGTGKTMFAQAAANEISAKFYSIKCSDIMNEYYGKSEANIREVFNEARKNPVSIIFFDEFEALAAKRRESQHYSPTTAQEILAQMQGFEKNQNQTLLVIAATNCPWNIDSAFLRPGRFDEKIYIPLPDKIARKEIVSKELWDIQAQIDINEIVKITEGFNSSDIVEFIERLKLHAIKRSIATRAVEPISQTDLLLVSKSCKSSVNKNDLIAMDEYNKQNNKNY